MSIALDRFPRFHLGDSASYLATRLGIYLPDDRSWTYGLAARWVVQMTGRLDAVPILQIILSALAACSLAWVLSRGSSRRGAAFGLCFAGLFLNPFDMFWSRAIMTDAPAGACLCLLAALLLARGRPWAALCLALLLSFLLFSLRSIFFLPLALALAGTALFEMVSWLTKRREAEPARHAAAAAVVILAYAAYAFTNQAVLGKAQPSTNYAASRFLASSWSPVLGPVLDRSGLNPGEIAQLLPLTDDNRLAQAFAPNGLSAALARHCGNQDAAGPAYAALLRAAVLQRPASLAGLVLRNWGRYLDPPLVLTYHRERRWTGTTNFGQSAVLPGAFITYLQSIGITQRLWPDMPQAGSPVLTYITWSGGLWHLLLAGYATLAILVVPAAFARRLRPEIVTLNLFAFLYMAMVASTSNAMVPRYLLPLAVPLVASAGSGRTVFARGNEADDVRPARRPTRRMRLSC